MATDGTSSMVAEIATLYKALAKGDTQTVAELVASELEYWFHGPPKCQHMMQVLTGESGGTNFKFEPRSIEVVGDYAIAEGWEGKNVYWVHVWTLKDGVITQFREYFNTWLAVRYTRPQKLHGRHTLWQSQPRDLVSRSFPGIVLAI